MIFSTGVTFHITDDDGALPRLTARAAAIDDENIGGHLAEYSIEQAFTVVFHNDPEWLFSNRMVDGWTVDLPNLFSQNRDVLLCPDCNKRLDRELAVDDCPKNYENHYAGEEKASA